MAVKTLIVVVTIDYPIASNVNAQITWPAGDTQRHNLNHDWSADMWDWRGGRAPQSLFRLLREWGLSLHGERLAYTSPESVGTASNEKGRVMVYEVDYEG